MTERSRSPHTPEPTDNDDLLAVADALGVIPRQRAGEQRPRRISDAVDDHFFTADAALTPVIEPDHIPAPRRARADARPIPIPAEAVPAPVSPELSWWRGLTLKSKVGIVALFTTVVGLPTVAVAAEVDWPFASSCADGTHADSNKEDDSLRAAAERITNERNYFVSVERLAAANGLSPDSLPSGRFCYVVPAPVIEGEYELTTGFSVDTIAPWLGMDPAELRRLNSNILPARNDEPIPIGTVLELTEKAPENVQDVFVLRVMREPDVANAVDRDPATMGRMLQANLPLLLAGANVAPGSVLFLPYNETDKTDWMDKVGLSPQQLMEQYAAQGAFDPARRNQPEVQPTVPLTITAEQQSHIDKLPLSETQKQFMKDILGGMGQIEADIQASARSKGIDPELLKVVMLAQALHETGYGTSNKVPFHNYFGMKADARWGDRPKELVEGEYWRAYPDIISGLRGYLENQDSKPWYDDRANAHSVKEFVQALLTHLGTNGYPDGLREPAYAEDPAYMSKLVDNFIVKLKIIELFGSKVQLETPAPVVKPGTIISPGKVKIDLSQYTNLEKSMWIPSPDRYGEAADNYYIVIGGQQVPLYKLSVEDQWRIIEAQLSGIELSPQGYEDFKKNMFRDISDEMMAKYPSLNGDKNTLGHFEPGQDIPMLWHYTANPTSVNGRTGEEFASSLNNGAAVMHTDPQWGNIRVGSSYYINDQGYAWQLTRDPVYHNMGQDSFRNGNSMGVEKAGCNQASINSKMYIAEIYLTMMHLEKYSPLKYGKNVSMSAVVNSMVRGHGEDDAVYEQINGAHTDGMPPVTDIERGLLIRLGVALGWQP